MTDIYFLGVQESVFSEEYHAKKHMIFVDYAARATTRDVKLNPELQEYKWIQPEEALTFSLAKGTRVAIIRYLNQQKYYRTSVSGLLVNDNKALIVRRSKDDEFLPGNYELPGGKIDFGEMPEQALEREFFEETGIQVSVGNPFRAFSYLSDHGNRHTIEIVFYVKSENIHRIKLSHEHDGHAWVSLEEIDNFIMSAEVKENIRKGFSKFAHQNVQHQASTGNIIEKKCWPEYFQHVLSGEKTCELRLADFECKPGDILYLREWYPKTKQYTGGEIRKQVTYVMHLNKVNCWPKEEIEKYGFQVICFRD